MAKKRAKRSQPERLKAPSIPYEGGPEGLVVDLRAGLPLPARARYHEELHDLRRSTDDSWQRALEFLWEQLGTRIAVHGAEIRARKELLGRYRMASQEERKFIRESLRAHLAEYFPEMERP
ncbi:MAG: hypothetical protein PGN13_08035 [Patulibacter minatonensis]